MSFIFELLANIILEFLLGSPGALVLWAFKGFKGSFSETLAENINKSAMIGFVCWLVGFAIISIMLNY